MGIFFAHHESGTPRRRGVGKKILEERHNRRFEKKNNRSPTTIFRIIYIYSKLFNSLLYLNVIALALAYFAELYRMQRAGANLDPLKSKVVSLAISLERSDNVFPLGTLLPPPPMPHTHSHTLSLLHAPIVPRAMQLTMCVYVSVYVCVCVCVCCVYMCVCPSVCSSLSL